MRYNEKQIITALRRVLKDYVRDIRLIRSEDNLLDRSATAGNYYDIACEIEKIYLLSDILGDKIANPIIENYQNNITNIKLNALNKYARIKKGEY